MNIQVMSGQPLSLIRDRLTVKIHHFQSTTESLRPHARAEPRLIAFGTPSQLGKFPPLPPWIEKISCGGDLR